MFARNDNNMLLFDVEQAADGETTSCTESTRPAKETRLDQSLNSHYHINTNIGDRCYY